MVLFLGASRRRGQVWPGSAMRFTKTGNGLGTPELPRRCSGGSGRGARHPGKAARRGFALAGNAEGAFLVKRMYVPSN